MFPNPWLRVLGRVEGCQQIICRVGFGVSPNNDRVYVDGLHVEREYRRKGFATSLLLAIVDTVSSSINGKKVPITALNEVHGSSAFWCSLRDGRVPGLTVTTDVRVGEMSDEASRWQ